MKDTAIRIKILRSLSFVVLLSVTYFSQQSYAQYMIGSVSQSLGGAGRAAVDPGEMFLQNPATIVHSPDFVSDLIYQDGYLAKDEHDRAYGLTLSDNSEGVALAGGFAYFDRRRTFDGPNTIEEKYYQASLGAFVMKHFSVGASLHYTKTDELGFNNYDQWDLDFGALYNPKPNFAVAFVAYNLTSRDKEIPVTYQNQDKISLAANWIAMPLIHTRFDISKQLSNNPNDRWIYQTGIASKFAEFFIIHLGYERNDLSDRNFYTLGLGFEGPKLTINYAYKKNEDYNGGALHGVDLRVSVW